VEVFVSTQRIERGEIISGERLYLSEDNTIYKIGLKVKGKLTFLSKLANLLIGVRNCTESWATTCIAISET